MLFLGHFNFEEICKAEVTFSVHFSNIFLEVRFSSENLNFAQICRNPFVIVQSVKFIAELNWLRGAIENSF